jgi:tRNA(Ile)-lysidine synthase
MISGGRDSTCLLDVAVSLLGASSVMALHVNYGLRHSAGADAERCRSLCAELGVELTLIEAPRSPGGPAEPAPGEAGGGNLQAWARGVRYGEAHNLARRHDALIAAGHTASDQVETILYRLAASPGRRALLGMAPVEGRLVRPLLGVTREQTTAYCAERGLGFSDDESNTDERFARSRVRHGLLEALRRVHPAAESNVLRTAMLLREETELLEDLVDRELAGRSSVPLARLREMPDALARLIVIRLAEQAVGGYVPQAGGRVQELLALGRRGGRAELHVGGQAGAVIEDGQLRMVRLPPRAEKLTPDGD